MMSFGSTINDNCSRTLILWRMSKMFAAVSAIKIISILMTCGCLLYEMLDAVYLFILM
jgi:hypothetical protein